jgi:hypothetical protein
MNLCSESSPNPLFQKLEYNTVISDSIHNIVPEHWLYWRKNSEKSSTFGNKDSDMIDEASLTLLKIFFLSLRWRWGLLFQVETKLWFRWRFALLSFFDGDEANEERFAFGFEKWRFGVSFLWWGKLFLVLVLGGWLSHCIRELRPSLGQLKLKNNLINY